MATQENNPAPSELHDQLQNLQVQLTRQVFNKMVDNIDILISDRNKTRTLIKNFLVNWKDWPVAIQILQSQPELLPQLNLLLQDYGVDPIVLPPPLADRTNNENLPPVPQPFNPFRIHGIQSHNLALAAAIHQMSNLENNAEPAPLPISQDRSGPLPLRTQFASIVSEAALPNTSPPLPNVVRVGLEDQRRQNLPISLLTASSTSRYSIGFQDRLDKYIKIQTILDIGGCPGLIEKSHYVDAAPSLYDLYQMTSFQLHEAYELITDFSH